MPLPHVQPFARTPVYFFTACTAGRKNLLAGPVSHACLHRIWTEAADRNGWFVGRYVLMPDHVHFFASPSRTAMPRSSWHPLWKSLSARQLVLELGAVAPVWQRDVFDHILRSHESYAAKWDYVRENPIRQGLVARADDWPWQGEIHRLEVR